MHSLYSRLANTEAVFAVIWWLGKLMQALSVKAETAAFTQEIDSSQAIWTYSAIKAQVKRLPPIAR